jgi:hypothetical protein
VLNGLAGAFKSLREEIRPTAEEELKELDARMQLVKGMGNDTLLFGLVDNPAYKKHELAVMQLQMQMQAQGHQEQLEEINAQADISESAALYKTYTTGISWVDALNGTVRPVIAYAFFVL